MITVVLPLTQVNVLIILRHHARGKLLSTTRGRVDCHLDDKHHFFLGEQEFFFLITKLNLYD